MAAAIQCPACAGTAGESAGTVNLALQHQEIFPFTPSVWQPLGRASDVSEYQLYACNGCGLVFASPMIAASATWYEIAYRALHVKPEERWEYEVVVPTLANDDRVYEIGCGTGAFLAHCRERNVTAIGIDFSPDAVAACRAQGFDAAVGAVSANSSSHGRAASVVASFHVLEHLQCPDDLFRHASRVAAPNATLWVSVPSNRRVARSLGLPDPLDNPPHHLTKWTEAALTAIGAKHGWHLVNVALEPFSWRSALWYVASNFAAYQAARTNGWLRRRMIELPFRASLYPAAFVRLLTTDVDRMSGFSMLAQYECVVRS